MDVQLGVNRSAMWRQIEQDYQKVQNPVYVVLRELIQNSVDAIRTKALFLVWLRQHLDRPGLSWGATLPLYAEHEATFRALRAARKLGVKPSEVDALLSTNPGRIDVRFTSITGGVQMEFTDNGIGMSRDIVVLPNGAPGPFLSLGDSGKGIGDAGGFGIAKAAIFSLGRKGWNVTTRDLRIAGTPPSQGMNVEVTEAPQAVDGTSFQAHVIPWHNAYLDGFGATQFGAPAQARVLLGASDLRGIRAYVDGGDPVRPLFANRQQWRKTGVQLRGGMGLDWGTGNNVEVSAFKRTETDADGTIVPGTCFVRLNGMLQFTTSPSGGTISVDVVLDFDTSLRPTDAAYPFNSSRNMLSGSAQEALRHLLDKFVVDAGSAASSGGYEVIAPDATDAAEKAASKRIATRLERAVGTDPSVTLNELIARAAAAERRLKELLATATPEEREVIAVARREQAIEEKQVRELARAIVVAGTEAATLEVAAKTGEEARRSFAWEKDRDTRAPEACRALRTFMEGISPFTTTDLDAFRDLYDFLGGEQNTYIAWTNLQRYVERALVTLGEMKRSPKASVTQGMFAQAIANMRDYLVQLFAASTSTIAESPAVRKAAAQINPFGDAATIVISRTNFSPERYKTFRENASRYDGCLLAWDQIVSALVAAYPGLVQFQGIGGVATFKRTRRSFFGGRYVDSENEVAPLAADAIPDFSVGFVLDDSLLGMNKSGLILVNPLRFREVVDAHPESPATIASWVFGVACHEVAHMFDPRGHKNHDEAFVVLREDLAGRCGYLLPWCEEVILRNFPRIVKSSIPPGCGPAVRGAKWKLTAEHNRAMERRQAAWDEEREGILRRCAGDPLKLTAELATLTDLSNFADFLGSAAGRAAAAEVGMDSGHVQQIHDALLQSPTVRRATVRELSRRRE